ARAGRGRRHADDTEEWRRPNCMRAHAPHVAVERPLEALPVAPRLAPLSRRHLVDPHDEGLTRLRTAHLERAGERVAAVLGLVLHVARVPVPPGVERPEGDRLAWRDRLLRLVLA